MLHYFTEKDSKQSYAINPEYVKYVQDFTMGPKIVFHDGSYIVVTDSYLETVARLNLI
jgi:hypothetical protein